MFFNICGAKLIQSNGTGDRFFYLPLASGIMLAISALVYPKPSEGFIRKRDVNTYKGFKDKVAQIKQFINVKDIRNSLIFFGLCSLIVPNYEEFLFSYSEENYHSGLQLDSITSVSLASTATLLVLLYNTELVKRVSIRTIVGTACLFRLVGAIVSVF